MIPNINKVRKQVAANSEHLQEVDPRTNQTFKRISGNASAAGRDCCSRAAYCVDDAPTQNVIPCYLDEFETGEVVDVWCSIMGAPGNLNEAIPRLEAGGLIFIIKYNGLWWCSTVFQSSEDCSCGAP